MEPEGPGFHIPYRLAAGFECFRVTIPPGADHPTSADDWSGALVVIEEGAIEVLCHGGARRSFGRGSFLALSWLPVVCLRNAGPAEAVIVGYRRRGGVRDPLAVP
jgi:hypothetical protein